MCQGGQLHKEANVSQLLRGLLLAGYMSARNNTQMSQQGNSVQSNSPTKVPALGPIWPLFPWLAC